MRGAWCSGGVAVFVMLVSSIAQAAPGRVVTLPVEVDGHLGAQWQRELQGGIAEGLSRGAFEVVTSEVACADAPCRSRAAAEHSARFVVRTRVTVDDRNYGVAISLLDPSSSETVAQANEVCELCGMQEVREMVADQAAALRTKLDGLATQPPVVVVESIPPEAVVFIDGELVGRAPVRREVKVGTHSVRAEKDGYVAVEREFSAVAGVEETLPLTLEPLPDIAPRVRPWGYVGLGLGLSSMAAGVTFLVLDERPAPGDRCAGANVDAAGQCRFRWNTLTPGLVFTVTGAVVALASSAVLVAMRPGRRRSGRRTAWMPSVRGMVLRF